MRYILTLLQIVLYLIDFHYSLDKPYIFLFLQKIESCRLKYEWQLLFF